MCHGLLRLLWRIYKLVSKLWFSTLFEVGVPKFNISFRLVAPETMIIVTYIEYI